MLDHEKQIGEYEEMIARLKQQNQVDKIWTDDEMIKLERKLDTLKKQVYSQLSPWERVAICRHPQRPRATDYIKHLCESFTEVFGDRLFSDDRSMITGFGIIEEEKFVVVAQEKGCDTESRLYRNFGMPHPEGYRKALRVMKLAAKFELPVLSLIDTPGAYPGLEAEERGQGWAIAHNLREMASLETPVISVLIGEGCSGGALGIGIANVTGMLEHAYYSVISPEGCASILWHDSAKNAEAAAALKMQAEDLIRCDVIDEVIAEPPGGAHHNPDAVYRAVKEFILAQKKMLAKLTKEELVETRYQKFRQLGAVQRAHSH